jgi:hypothetical protein
MRMKEIQKNEVMCVCVGVAARLLFHYIRRSVASLSMFSSYNTVVFTK